WCPRSPKTPWSAASRARSTRSGRCSRRRGCHSAPVTAATHPLSLHQLVVADTTPLELVGLAAATGCAHVCLFTQPPEGPVRFPVVEADAVGALARAMDGEGVTAYGITSFAVGAATDVAAYRPAL